MGVGGQGSLLASRIIGNVLLSQGFDVKVSEVHGMSQRGGSVVTYVKYGSEVCSPVVEKGEADIIISFEQLEAARYVSYLKKGGHIITSTQQIDPMPVITGAAVYPEDIIGKLKAEGVDVIAVDALALAEQAGREEDLHKTHKIRIRQKLCHAFHQTFCNTAQFHIRSACSCICQLHHL